MTQMQDDPRRVLAQSPMTARQIVGIAMCLLLNALDGFDVLSISFASPGIAREWSIDRAALGVVLSVELIGMIAGSVVLGQVADRIGRRPTVLGCLVVMAVGMFATTQVGSVGQLAATRLFTGLGIGGMLATTNALAAEYANDRRRAAAVAVMAAGYPLGAIIGGSIAGVLLRSGDWRQVFLLGAGMTVLFLPLVPWLMPEPVSALIQRRPADVLERVNRSLRALGHAPVTALPPASAQAPRRGFADVFGGGLAPVTILLTLAYFMHVMTFYFTLKWVPKIVVDMGFPASSASAVLVWANVGGLLGSLAFSALSLRFPPRGLLVGTMLASVVMVALFGQTPADLGKLSRALAFAGFFTNAGIVGLYVVVAASFPTRIRASGTGVVIGLGRGGAALGPVAAGLLFQSGFTLASTAAIMACGSLVAAVAILALPRRAGAPIPS
jgi:benzoate transport